MDVNFEYYKVFYYVAKYKNFTKAAHALGSGQPNVTRAMPGFFPHRNRPPPKHLSSVCAYSSPIPCGSSGLK